MTEELLRRVREALLLTWSRKTCGIFTEEMHPSYGQCAQTTIVIHETFGGEILRTAGWPPHGRHFYNRINNVRLDFTAQQFSSNSTYCKELIYEDIASNVQEAESETKSTEIEAMRTAFCLAFQKLQIRF